MAASSNIIPLRWGAQPEDWAVLATEHDLRDDLLPVVSNPRATISPISKLREIGKVPSRYGADGGVVGIASWTDRRTTDAQIRDWQSVPDYGICIQTRRLRAVDVDVTDPALAERAWRVIVETLGAEPPRRTRANSSKFLVPVWCEDGEARRKRVLELPGDAGAVEILATGQQFIAVGTHPSGVRYDWGGPLPEEFPRLEPEELDALVLRLQDALGATVRAEREPAKERAAAVAEAAQADLVAQWLYDHGLVRDVGRDGQLFVQCPNAAAHTRDSGPTATAYFPAHTGGFQQGHWKCLHAHCAGKPDGFFNQLLDMIEFEDLTGEAEAAAAGEGGEGRERAPGVDAPEGKALRFRPMSVVELLQRAVAVRWLVKNVVPASGVITLFGESGAGKSFAVIDMACHIALGWTWQGLRTKRGRVVYVAAEGASGIRDRIRAWCEYNGVDPAELSDLEVITAAPNFLQREDVSEVAEAIGEAAMVIVDTLMAVTPGGDENSGEDMGRVLKYLALLAQRVGGVVCDIHHAGKDVSRGQRGWSGLKGAVDAELEVTREGDARCLRLSKVRDGSMEGHRWFFRLQDVRLGYDEDGDAYGSAVVVFSEPPAAASRGPRLTDLQELIVRVTTDLVAMGADVSEEDVVAESVRRIPRPDGRDIRRQSVKKSIVRLARMSVLVFEDDRVRLG